MQINIFIYDVTNGNNDKSLTCLFGKPQLNVNFTNRFYLQTASEVHTQQCSLHCHDRSFLTTKDSAQVLLLITNTYQQYHHTKYRHNNLEQILKKINK